MARQPKLTELCEGAKAGGPDRDQTDDLFVANEALYQLSYRPKNGTRGIGKYRPPSKHQFSDPRHPRTVPLSLTC
jgi:hypothetical protein